MSIIFQLVRILISALLIVVGFIIGLVFCVRRARIRRTMTFIAERFAGVLVMPPIFLCRRSRVLFRYRDGHAELSTFWRWRGGRKTRLKLVWPSRWELSIASRELVNAPRPSTAWQFIPTDGEPAGRYVVYSSDPAMCQRVLTPPLWWQIDQLRGMASQESLALQIARGKFVATINGFSRDPQALHEWMLAILRVFDQMMLSQQQGMEFVETENAVVLETVLCPVCSAEMHGPIVMCARCNTPHCADCWHYNGKCAMYACGESRYVSA